MTDWYFAYGSNMNPARMEARGLAVIDVQGGHLKGFELCFNKRATGKTNIAYANIGYCPHRIVEGVLYQLQTPDDIALMDPFEGNPVRYSREVFKIFTESGSVDAWVYVANAAYVADELLPEEQYLRHLQAGRRWHSAEYQDWLLNHPTATCEENTSSTHSSANGLIYNV